jgi:hypothetical protein
MLAMALVTAFAFVLLTPSLAEATEGEVTVAVRVSACHIGPGFDGKAHGTVRATINPDGEATISIYSDAGKTDGVGTLSSSSAGVELAPGTYYWDATAADGFELVGTSSGQFTIEDCSPQTEPPREPPTTEPPASVIETAFGCDLETSQFVVSATNVGSADVLVGIVWDSGDTSDNLEAGEVLSAVIPAGEYWTLFEENVPVEQGLAESCDEVSPTSITATTAPEVAPTEETLPFTGAESGPGAGLALLLVAGGALALVGARSIRAEADE